MRPAGRHDVPAITAIYNHYIRHTAATFFTTERTVEERTEWAEHYADTGPHRLLVATDSDGTVLGYASASRYHEREAYDPTVETSVYVAPDATGRGVGSALYDELFAILDAEPSLHLAYAAISVPNDASLALHRQFGFTEAGRLPEVGRKLGRWWTVVLMTRPIPLAR